MYETSTNKNNTDQAVWFVQACVVFIQQKTGLMVWQDNMVHSKKLTLYKTRLKQLAQCDLSSCDVILALSKCLRTLWRFMKIVLTVLNSQERMLFCNRMTEVPEVRLHGYNQNF